MRVETTFTNDNVMMITYPGGIISETNINTGITKVFKNGAFKIEWPDMSVKEFCKRQRYIVEAGEIVDDSKPKLKD